MKKLQIHYINEKIEEKISKSEIKSNIDAHNVYQHILHEFKTDQLTKKITKSNLRFEVSSILKETIIENKTNEEEFKNLIGAGEGWVKYLDLVKFFSLQMDRKMDVADIDVFENIIPKELKQNPFLEHYFYSMMTSKERADLNLLGYALMNSFYFSYYLENLATENNIFYDLPFAKIISLKQMAFLIKWEELLEILEKYSPFQKNSFLFELLFDALIFFMENPFKFENRRRIQTLIKQIKLMKNESKDYIKEVDLENIIVQFSAKKTDFKQLFMTIFRNPFVLECCKQISDVEIDKLKESLPKFDKIYILDPDSNLFKIYENVEALTLMNGQILITSSSAQFYDEINKHSSEMAINNLEEYGKLLIRIYHERAGHFNRRFLRDEGLLFLDSFRNFESGTQIEYSTFKGLNLVKMMDEEIAKLILDIEFWSDPAFQMLRLNPFLEKNKKMKIKLNKPKKIKETLNCNTRSSSFIIQTPFKILEKNLADRHSEFIKCKENRRNQIILNSNDLNDNEIAHIDPMELESPFFNSSKKRSRGKEFILEKEGELRKFAFPFKKRKDINKFSEEEKKN